MRFANCDSWDLDFVREKLSGCKLLLDAPICDKGTECFFPENNVKYYVLIFSPDTLERFELFYFELYIKMGYAI